MILRCLTEGMSIRATVRTTGTSIGTVLRLLEEAGEFCAGYSDLRLRNLPSKRIEADEIHSYVGAKQRNAKTEGHGDLWTFCAIDADSKLVCSWLVGARSPDSANIFVDDLAGRLANRVQLTTDGHGMYLTAVRRAFSFGRVDYAQVIKEMGQEYGADASRRYSPPVVIGIQKVRLIGRPDLGKASTSYVENLNLGTRQRCKRFARLTSAHSRKAENHVHAVALHFFAHNFLRAHGTLTKEAGAPTSPAMAAGLTDRVWTLDDLVAMMDPRSVTVK